MYTYPRSSTFAYAARVLFDEGRFLEATSSDRAKAGRTGAPERSMPAGNGGALGGAAPSLGRAGSPSPGGWFRYSRLQGCPLVPWRLPPLHPLAGSRGSFANLGRLAPRECKSVAV